MFCISFTFTFLLFFSTARQTHSSKKSSFEKEEEKNTNIRKNCRFGHSKKICLFLTLHSRAEEIVVQQYWNKFFTFLFYCTIFMLSILLSVHSQQKSIQQKSSIEVNLAMKISNKYNRTIPNKQSKMSFVCQMMAKKLSLLACWLAYLLENFVIASI